MNSNLPYIAEGFKSDCKKLVNRFTEVDDIRFQRFCEIWKDMKFSMVFLGRSSYIDLLEFCEEAMMIAKDLVQPPHEFKEQIAGLYLLYGLYYKQPVHGVKIRVTLYEWQNIMSLFHEIKEGEHLDALYILSKLLDDSAFHHVLTNREYCIGRRQRSKDVSVTLYEDPMFLKIKGFLQETDILENIDNMCKRYKDKKSELNMEQKSEKQVEVFNPNIAQTLRKNFEDLKGSNIKEDAPSCSHGPSQTLENPKSKEDSLRCKNYLSRMKPVKNRAKIGRGFDTDSSEDEEEDIEEIDEMEDDEDDSPAKPSTSSTTQNELMVLTENASEEFSD